jgi:hypothetical protein
MKLVAFRPAHTFLRQHTAQFALDALDLGFHRFRNRQRDERPNGCGFVGHWHAW